MTHQLTEWEKHNEKLECEVAGLRKELEKTKSINLRFSKGSETLDGIIEVRFSPLIKIGLGYTRETSQPENSSAITESYLNLVKTSQQCVNPQQRPKVTPQVNHAHSTPRVNINRSTNQKVNNTKIFYDHGNFFLSGQCFSFYEFGHKVAQCVSYKNIMTREARKKRSVTGIKKSSYNNFSPLEDEIECSF